MPQAIPAVAAWAAAAWSSAVTVTSVALAKVGFVAAIGEGATIALAGSILKTAALTGLSAAATALLRPNTPSSGTALDFKPDPKAPVRGLMGYHATGGNKVFQATWGYNGVAMSLGVALSLGPIDAITRFEADGVPVTFSGAQSEATGFYAADMWQKTTLGLPTDAALLPPTGLKYQNPALTGWGTQNAAKGVAFAFWTMVLAKNPEDRDIFVNGVPDPLWIGRWMKIYDWRKDSTYPGGSGTHREDDWRTWEWTENPYLHARAWLRGHFKLNDDGTIDRTRRIAGVGVPASAIDMAAFTEAANIAATNQWKISGEWSTSDNKWQVLAGMMQAGSGVPINRGAQVSVMVNTPRVSTYTYTRDDMVGQAVVRPLVRRRDRKNTVIPRYRSEQHKWEYVGAGEVTSSVYRDEDRGEPRTTEVQYTFVRDAKQAGQLAAYDLVNMREGLTVTLPSKVHLMHVHAGDCITVNVPEMALANQKVIVMRTTTDYKGAVTTLECRSETDGKHAFALGQAANPPPSPSLSAVDPLYIPPPLPVDVVVIPKPPSNGTSQPIIEVEIPVDRGDIAATVVEFGLTSTGPWTSAGPADPSTGKYTLSGLNPNQEYWISVRYVANNGTISERYVTGPHVAPGLTAGDVDPNSPTLIAFDAELTELEGALASETVIRQDQVSALQVESASLTAEVTTNTTAVINLETQQALAKYEVVAAASGGKPARLRLVSSSLGSAIALDAPYIFFGDNTTLDDTTDTLSTVIGPNVRVIAWGAPFGSSSNLLEWWGPSSIALSAMTTANGYNGRMTDSPYVFDNVNTTAFTASSNLAVYTGTTTAAGNVTTSLATITVVGATGTVSYSWSQVGGNEEWTITADSAASTAFRTTVSTPGEQKRATFACRVSDSGTGKVVTVVVGAVGIYNV